MTASAKRYDTVCNWVGAKLHAGHDPQDVLTRVLTRAVERPTFLTKPQLLALTDWLLFAAENMRSK